MGNSTAMQFLVLFFGFNYPLIPPYRLPPESYNTVSPIRQQSTEAEGSLETTMPISRMQDIVEELEHLRSEIVATRQETRVLARF